MGLANCRNCGRLFNQVSRDICPICEKEEEQLFYDIRAYLKEHRNATTYEVSEATGAPINLIIRFIKEGRLTVSSNPHLAYPCERCGQLITQGRFCKKCTAELQKDLDALKEKVKPVTEAKTGAYYYGRNKQS